MGPPPANSTLVAVGPLVVAASRSKPKAFHAGLFEDHCLGACARAPVYICFPVLSHQGLPLATVYVFLFVYSVA